MSSPSLECPITYFEKNFYFNTSGGCWAAFKLKGVNYDYQSDKTKLNILARSVQVIKNVSKAKIMVVPTTENVKLHYENLKKGLRSTDALYDKAILHANKTCDHLKKVGQDENDYTTYILVKLKDDAVDGIELAWKHIIEFFKAPIYSLTARLLLNPHDITAVAFEKFKKWEEEVFQTLSAYVEIQELSSSETQWLIKRVNYKGLKKAVVLNKMLETITDEVTGKITKRYSEEWTPFLEKGKKRQVEYYRPLKSDVANLFSGVLKCEGYKGISITHDDGDVSYQSYLVLTNIPKCITYPGDEWIYSLQKLPMAVEICIDIENIYYEKAKETLFSKQTEINTQMENIVKANASMPTELLEASQMAESFKRELGDNKLPMSMTSISLCVAGSSMEQVESDVKDLMSHLKGNEFAAVCPSADQLKLYMQHIPGAESYALDFQKPLSPAIIAGGTFGIGNRVGDNKGGYIGMANGKPVYLRPAQACKENVSPAGTLYGDLGYGKSFNVNLILYLHVLYGGYGIVICPKGERKHWKQLPLIGDVVNVVELTTDLKNKGKLDPFIMFRHDLAYAGFLAENVFLDLLSSSISERGQVLLSESIERVQGLPNPSMLKVVKDIENIKKSDPWYEQAEILSRTLRAKSKSGMLMLLMGDGDEEAISVKGRLNVITMQGIAFPEKSTLKEDYTPEEKIASILFTVIASTVRYFAAIIPNNIPKMGVIDESWAVSGTKAGANLIEWTARQGRSLYFTLMLNGHSVLDLPNEKLRTMITYKFCFHTSDLDEAKMMLKYLKIDATPENIETIMNLENRECLFSDMYGRVSLLKFDAIFDDVINFFNTTPEDAPEEPAEIQQPASEIINATEPEETDPVVEQQPKPEIQDVLFALDEVLRREGKLV